MSNRLIQSYIEMNPNWQERYDNLMFKLNTGDFHLSFSSFKHFMVSPAMFILNKIKDRKPSDAMLQGSVFDCLSLEPEKFDERYIVEPNIKLSSPNQYGFAESIRNGLPPEDAYLANYKGTKNITTKVKEKIKELLPLAQAYNDFFNSIGEREVIPFEIWHSAKTQSLILETDPYTGKFLKEIREHPDSEVQKFIEFDFMGFKFRGALDAHIPGVFTADLKKVRSSDRWKMKYNVRDEKLDIQAVIYKLGTDTWNDPYYLLTVDNQLQCSTIEISNGTAMQALSKLKYYLLHFERCILTEEWGHSINYYAPGGVYVI